MKDQPAFPVPVLIDPISGKAWAAGQMIEGCGGITIRQYAAIKAMQGLLARVPVDQAFSRSFVCAVASDSVEYADALIAELDKPTPKP